MNKIPDCDRCQYFSHQLYFVCAVHPEGIEGDYCPDFQPELEPTEPEAIRQSQRFAPAIEEELWAPTGYLWYNGELIPNRSITRAPENDPQNG